MMVKYSSWAKFMIYPIKDWKTKERTQPALGCWKPATEAAEQCVKYVKSYSKESKMTSFRSLFSLYC